MGKVYVIRKAPDIGMAATGSSFMPQINLNSSGGLTDEERMGLGRYGQMGAQLGRYIAPAAAAWSALSSLADDNQSDGLTALGRAGLSGYTTYGLAQPAERYLGGLGNYIDNYGKPKQRQTTLGEFDSPTSPASPNASTGDNRHASPNPVEAANTRLNAISSEEAKEALKDQNALAENDDNEDVETNLGGLRRDNVKVTGR
jgi:hypothetical protein